MINTYHSSLAPPPVPPRQTGHQVLIPAPYPSKGHSKTLVRFLVGVALLHLFLSVGGFIYLYLRDEKETSATFKDGKPREGKAALRSAQAPSEEALAHLVVDNETAKKSISGYLQWDFNHSNLTHINPFLKSWLTILKPGNYHVYSRVTFTNGDSKGDRRIPLTSRVKLKMSMKGTEKVVMKAYCHLDMHKGPETIPGMCTATQGEVIRLEKGNQLSVWVQDLSLVDYDKEATTFGMYKLS